MGKVWDSTSAICAEEYIGELFEWFSERNKSNLSKLILVFVYFVKNLVNDMP